MVKECNFQAKGQIKQVEKWNFQKIGFELNFSKGKTLSLVYLYIGNIVYLYYSCFVMCFVACFINALLGALLKFDEALDRAKIHSPKKYFKLFVVLLVGCLVLRNLFRRFVGKDLNNGN